MDVNNELVSTKVLIAEAEKIELTKFVELLQQMSQESRAKQEARAVRNEEYMAAKIGKLRPGTVIGRKKVVADAQSAVAGEEKEEIAEKKQ